MAVYSFCQHSSHNAHPRHTFSAARSKMTAGFSSCGGGVRLMLSYSSRSSRPVEMGFQGRALGDVRGRFPQKPLSAEDPPGQG